MVWGLIYGVDSGLGVGVLLSSLGVIHQGIVTGGLHVVEQQAL